MCMSRGDRDDQRGVAEDLLAYIRPTDAEQAKLHNVNVSSDQGTVEAVYYFPRYRCPRLCLLGLLRKALSKVNQGLWSIVLWHMQLDELPRCQYSVNTGRCGQTSHVDPCLPKNLRLPANFRARTVC